MRWMHPENFHNDTRSIELVLECGYEGYGIFMALLERSLSHPQGWLEGGLKVASAAIRSPFEVVQKVVDVALRIRLLTKLDENVYACPDVTEDIKSFNEKKQKLREAGMRGAQARLKGGLKGGLRVMGKERLGKERNGKVLKEGGVEGENTPAIIEQKNFHPPTSNPLPLPPNLDRPEVREALTDWLEYKRARREIYKSNHWLSALLKNFPDSPDELVAAIRTAISSNNQGIYPARGSQNGNIITEKDRVMARVAKNLPKIQELGIAEIALGTRRQ